MTNDYLERRDYDAIKDVTREKGFVNKDFSATLRLIIREWEKFTHTISPKLNASCRLR